MKLLLLVIRVYQKLISPFLGTNCRFYPTCSSYSYQVFENQGIYAGLVLSLKRILRCHPWNAGGFDPPILKGNINE